MRKIKLFELLDTAKETGDIIIRESSIRGCTKRLRYFEKYKQFMFVKENGELILPDNPSRCSIELSDDLLHDDFYLMPVKTEKQRLYDLIDNHAISIDDLELLVGIVDYGISAKDIAKAVQIVFPFSSYTFETKNRL